MIGTRDLSEEAFEGMARVVEEGETCVLFLESLPVLPAGWKLEREVPLVQMVLGEGREPAETEDGVEELGAADVEEMLALTGLTRPGPFGRRTRELGSYLGIRQKGRLVAMAGERLRMAGFTEVSAVCTHPEFTGRGYARRLIAAVMRRIRLRGERPFLHAAQENTRAIGVYEEIGFKIRKRLAAMVMLRA